MSPLLAIALLLTAESDFNPRGDRDRTIGDPARVPSERDPDPDPRMVSFARAIRFTAKPALRAGEGNVVTVTPGEKGEAVAMVKTLRRQCGVSSDKCRLVPAKGVSFAFCVQGDCSYAGFERRVHVLMFDPARMQQAADDDVIVCTDGPGYFTELREGGETYNLSGFCAKNHPNNAIYQLVRDGAGANWPRIGPE